MKALAGVLCALILAIQYPLWLGKGGWLRVWELDRQASARPLWTKIASQPEQVCVDWLKRDLRYGLNYYSVTPLPDCAQQPRPIHIKP